MVYYVCFFIFFYWWASSPMWLCGPLLVQGIPFENHWFSELQPTQRLQRFTSLTSSRGGTRLSLCLSEWGVGLVNASVAFNVLCLGRQVGTMAERAAGNTSAISPVQQMLASGTGALLTSVFGERFCEREKKICTVIP